MTYKFTPEQEAWLVDLETTEEPQTTGLLHDNRDRDPGYCCLGRACVVMGIKEEVQSGIGYFDKEHIGLPAGLVHLLRLHGDCGEFKDIVEAENDPDLIFENLADLNDNGWSFKEIAAYIRANPENVFLPPEEETKQEAGRA